MIIELVNGITVLTGASDNLVIKVESHPYFHTVVINKHHPVKLSLHDRTDIHINGKLLYFTPKANLVTFVYDELSSILTNFALGIPIKENR